MVDLRIPVKSAFCQLPDEKIKGTIGNNRFKNVSLIMKCKEVGGHN
jgi:hypothetical protein